MRINNVSAKTSIRTILVGVFFLVLYTGFSVWMYLISESMEYSFFGYIQWAIEYFKRICSGTESLEMIIFYILPVVLPLFVITQIIERNKALNSIDSFENLRSVDFLDNKIEFKFYYPQYDFSCGYRDVEKLEIEIDTNIVRSKTSSSTVISEVKLIFTVLNGKRFYIYNTASCGPMGFIYKVLDYAKNMKSYSYRFVGVGDINGFSDKIENYLKYGLKRVVSKNSVAALKMTSILFFVLGCIFLYCFHGWFEPGDMNLFVMLMFMPSVFLFISFIIDALLLFDDIRLNNINKGL